MTTQSDKYGELSAALIATAETVTKEQLELLQRETYRLRTLVAEAVLKTHRQWGAWGEEGVDLGNILTAALNFSGEEQWFERACTLMDGMQRPYVLVALDLPLTDGVVVTPSGPVDTLWRSTITREGFLATLTNLMAEIEKNPSLLVGVDDHDGHA